MAESTSQLGCGCVCFSRLMVLLKETTRVVEDRDLVFLLWTRQPTSFSQKQAAEQTASEGTSAVDDGQSLSSLFCKTCNSGGSCDLLSDQSHDLNAEAISRDTSGEGSCHANSDGSSKKASGIFGGTSSHGSTYAAHGRPTPFGHIEMYTRFSESSHDLNAEADSRDTFGEERHYANSGGSFQKAGGNCGGAFSHGSTHAEHGRPTPFGHVESHARFSEPSYDLNAESNSSEASSDESCYPNSNVSSQKNASGNESGGTSSHEPVQAEHGEQAGNTTTSGSEDEVIAKVAFRVYDDRGVNDNVQVCAVRFVAEAVNRV
eukprot:TRINITY_DN805_c0_g1_i6.p1 TRINITY_DN805_c0_g1~~TRINITY_DN805_c0_g1_i6.p1  ORF type:complete len:348 (+),score=47.93 TRINITY_DN805_c0_g1_i6:93-1046(+)